MRAIKPTAILCALLVVSVCSSAIFAQQELTPRVVIKVQAVKYPGDGTVVLVLGHGRELRLDAAAVDRTMTEQLQKTLGQPAPPIAIPSNESDAPTLAEAQPGIRTKCEKEWPKDFSVRAYCEKTQAEALAKLRTRLMTATADHYTIRRKCAREWPDDFTVRNYCEETELKALAALGK